MVFLSDVSPGGDLQSVIAKALASCKLAIILATKTYGAKTNGLFDTSNEMNYIIDNGRKPYYLVRMIPFGEDWAEERTTMAFPSSVMQKVRAACLIRRALFASIHRAPPGCRLLQLTLLLRAPGCCHAVVARRQRRSDAVGSRARGVRQAARTRCDHP